MKHQLIEAPDWFDCSCGEEHIRANNRWEKCNVEGHDPKCMIVDVDVGEAEPQEFHILPQGGGFEH